MKREIEAKFRVADPAPLRARLQQCGGARRGRVHETNHILDTPDRRMLGAGCGLRVRVWRSLEGDGGAGATLTFKGPRESGEFKSRPEIETALTDSDGALAILARVGFHEVIRYEKRRETWHLGDCEVVLDELPHLGWFVEIEGPDADAVQSARRRLGLTDTPLVDETYAHLTARHGDATAGGRTHLIFKQRAC